MVLLEFKSLFIGIGLEDALNDPIFRDISEGPINDIRIDNPFFFLGVIIGTGAFLTALCITANSLIIRWMILLFFPAVAHIAIGAYLTPTRVVIDVILGFPVDAGLHRKRSTIGS